MNLTPELRDEYRRLWNTMQIRPERISAVDTILKRILLSVPRYHAITQSTGVPWYLVAVIHSLEAGGNWKTHLHNGDPLTARTKQVPRGRPRTGSPPFTWEASAEDALRYDGLADWKDWSPPGLLFTLEGFNGWGYRRYHAKVLTPYLCSFSNHYDRGKYVADGVWDARAVSGQCGAAVLLRRLADRDQIKITED